MEYDQAYKEVIETIVAHKIRLFGNFALYIVKTTPGLEMDNYGRVVSLSGEPKEVIHQLLLRFEDKVGKISTLIDKSLIEGLKNKYPELNLPSELL
jgi:hypothetical protein